MLKLRIFFLSEKSKLFLYFSVLVQHFLLLSFLKLFYFFTDKLNEFHYEIYLPLYELNLINGFSYTFLLHFGIDGISLLFIFLTILLIWVCLIISIDTITDASLLYCFLFFFLELFLILSFLSLDLLFFYIFFEIILIPMFFLIIIWGSRSRKILASFFFFFYTAFGSIFILISILILGSEFGVTDISYLWNFLIPFKKQILIWIFLFFGFCIKIPMFPFHSWLPEAHVEAPTQGSIILAGILLKLGGYGFIRFLLPLCNDTTYIYLPLVYSQAFLGIVYVSIIILRQLDIKKIIAYSSIIHMNIAVLGIFSLSFTGLSGSLVVMIGHGLISSGLFLLIGCLYERYTSRNLNYYGGIVNRMPLFVTFFFLFTLSNISFPGTINFMGEFLIFLGILEYSYFSFFINLFFTIFFGAFYSFWLFNRISFGELKVLYLFYYYDLTESEFISLFILFFWIILIGCYPFLFFDLIIFPIKNLILRYN
jgi:proton-translocating NADH-quinone oxidoreductase chain M